jgi:hypothetical protein
MKAVTVGTSSQQRAVDAHAILRRFSGNGLFRESMHGLFHAKQFGSERRLTRNVARMQRRGP